MPDLRIFLYCKILECKMCKYIYTRWACDLTGWTPTLRQLTRAVAAVQVEERERLMKFHFWDDFISSLVGRLLMRKYVSSTSGLGYDKVHFERDELGKPYWHLNPQESSCKTLLRTPYELSFNVSHQGGIVILAGVTLNDKAEELDTVSDNSGHFGVGADVMKIEYSGGKALNEFFRLMRNKFSDIEWSNIIQGGEQQQLKSFMRHWCLKESFVKEMGVGITIDLRKISFEIQSLDLEADGPPLTDTILRFDDALMTNCYFEEHLLQPKYCAAITFRNCIPNKVEKFEFLNMENLIEEATASSDDIHLVDYCERALKKQRRDLKS